MLARRAEGERGEGGGGGEEERECSTTKKDYAAPTKARLYRANLAIASLKMLQLPQGRTSALKKLFWGMLRRVPDLDGSSAACIILTMQAQSSRRNIPCGSDHPSSRPRMSSAAPCHMQMTAISVARQLGSSPYLQIPHSLHYHSAGQCNFRAFWGLSVILRRYYMKLRCRFDWHTGDLI